MKVEEEVDPKLPDPTCDDDGHPLRTGTLKTCVAHIITAVIGSGVLSLAWSTAQLGWIAGPGSMLCFAAITYISVVLLSDCYRCPDPITGKRNPCYIDAVRVYLGKKQSWACGLFQIISFYGTGVAYVITTAASMRAIQKSDCYHSEGHNAPCASSGRIYMLVFGVVQIVLSQIPNFHDMEWLSITAAAMSFSYSFIGLALGFAKTIGNGRIKGSISGVSAASKAQKIYLTFQALGDVAFAYPYSLILLEIQDTLKSSPPENKIMKKGSVIAIIVTTFFYLGCGCFGYAAFGDLTPGNLLSGFGFYEPFWLIDFANACIILHLVGGYQVYSQPVYAVAERWIMKKFPNNGYVNKYYKLRLPMLPSFQLNLLRLCFRTAYVVSTTLVAILFPYFNQILGVLGALNFWPLAIYFPVQMYIVQKKIGVWTRKWNVLQAFSMVCLAVTLMGLVGSIEGLISAKLD